MGRWNQQWAKQRFIKQYLHHNWSINPYEGKWICKIITFWLFKNKFKSELSENNMNSNMEDHRKPQNILKK